MTGDNQKPIRILQVVGAMNRGGAETWLMHVLRHIDCTRFQFDFLVHTTEPGAYDDEIRMLGSSLIICPYVAQPFEYARALIRILRVHGPYDVVHSHVHDFSGWVLRIAKREGVPIRIAHSHSDTAYVRARANLLRRTYTSIMGHCITANATVGLAASRKAARALFGARWQIDPRWRVLYCGIDLDAYDIPDECVKLRSQFGLPSDALVLGHVGRFLPVKNHRFLLRITKEVLRYEPNTRLLLVGDGPERTQVHEMAERLGIAHAVVFAGLRTDIPRILNMMDVFVFPSLYEGLPLTCVEAQAAGIPVLMSDSITSEVVASEHLVQSLPIHATDVCLWAAKCFESGRGRHNRRSEGFSSMLGGKFDVHSSVRALCQVYAGKRAVALGEDISV